MMYDGIVRSLQAALAAYDITTPDRIEIINNNVLLAEEIISQLQLSLDMDNGGEIAKGLDSLYDFWTRHLSEANVSKSNVRKSAANIREVLEMATSLREAWVTATAEARKLGLG